MDVLYSCYIEYRFIYERLAFGSSAMGFQGDSGVNVPLGAVATATIKLDRFTKARKNFNKSMTLNF
ncbi:hypothetical protein DXX93_12765 [Thalassotalea euphylliae]|uniref:Uncharacterized protein n=2 Tax=Thalassotalea euphylliae TaxID=1655234 RepID=A0A3E0TSI3_9GAMM|nr:hypothetical protein DXX93_12765 [Thalassotalea euphylliae]